MMPLTKTEKAEILSNYVHQQRDEYADVYAGLLAGETTLVSSAYHIFTDSFETFRSTLSDYYRVQLLWHYQDNEIVWRDRDNFQLYLFKINVEERSLTPLREQTFKNSASGEWKDKQFIAINQQVPSKEMLEKITRQFCAVNEMRYTTPFFMRSIFIL